MQFARSRDGAGRDSGQVIVFTVVALIAFAAMAAFVVDVGYAYFTQRSLQASADAAALAGAQQLPDSSAATSTATQFGTGKSAKNAITRATVSETITTKCLTSIPGCSPVNAVVVDETAHVNSFFAQLVGLSKYDVHVRATACAPCGVKPLDVMVVLDRTGSMCQDSSGANDPTCFDLNNAKTGIRTFLSFMDKSVDAVGLAVLPPAANAAATCSTPSGSNYNSSGAPYLMVPLSQDYKLKDGSLNVSSNLVSTLNCIKGGGTTSYASAIDVAQAELVARGRAGVQKVIIFLSDGAANTGPSFLSKTSPARTQPCHAGITAASNARGAGTVVYSIGYALADDTGGCKADTGAVEKPAITVWQAMQGIADAGNFYDKPSPGQLNTIFTQIASDIAKGSSGLVPDNTK